MQQVAHYTQLVGQVIRGRRELQQLSLSTMAEQAAASTSGWSRIETGETAMTLGQLRKAARSLHVEPSEILTQADRLAAQLQARGVEVYDEKPKDKVGKWALLGGAGILGLVAGAAAAAASGSSSTHDLAARSVAAKPQKKKERP